MHPATIREPARDLRVADSADVVVAGGGVAGIAAAVAAARAGASVLLLERTCTPGGLATAGNVAIYLPICDGCGRQVLGGLAEELLRLSVADLRREVPAAGFFREPAAWRDPAATPGERAKGGRFQTGFDPAAFSLALEALLLREGVRILYDTRVCAVAREGAAISHLVVENKSGRTAVACRAVVDATGDADVCFLAGERTESLATNVPACWYYALGAGDAPVRLRYLSNPYDKDAGTGGGAKGPFLRGDDAADVAAHVLASRELVRADLAALRAANPGADAQPFALPSIPCLRMTRRLVGALSLGEADLHDWFDDAVCLAPDWRRAGPVWAIPWRCLVAPRTANLAACGRCASWDRTAWDALRAIPVCAATGEAAGLGAALAARDGVALADLDPRRLAAALRDRGVNLDPELLR